MNRIEIINYGTIFFSLAFVLGLISFFVFIFIEWRAEKKRAIGFEHKKQRCGHGGWESFEDLTK